MRIGRSTHVDARLRGTAPTSVNPTSQPNLGAIPITSRSICDSHLGTHAQHLVMFAHLKRASFGQESV
jgi:hypothetical protein